MLVKNSPLRGGHAREKFCRQGSLARENQQLSPNSATVGSAGTAAQPLSPLEQLNQVLSHYDHPLDEPETIPFIAKLRADGVLDDGDWAKILNWLDDAMRFLKLEPGPGQSGIVNLDADPRNADWIRAVRAQRFAAHRMPGWASLWLWWLGYNREGGPFWPQVARVAEATGLPKLQRHKSDGE